MKRAYILLILSIISISVFAEKISIKITAPKEVGIGETFTIEYEIGTTDISNFQPPTFKGFSILDTRRSSSSSTSIINGQRTSKSTTNITYLLRADNTGTFTIEPATFILQGEVFKSRSIPIKVSANCSHSSNNTSTSSNSYSTSGSKNQPTPRQAIPSDSGNLFIRAYTSKTKVYEQEAILLTYKIYANADVSGFQGKLPVLNGFHIQELEPSKEQNTETVNGRTYITAVWKQYVLYPQSPGTFEIPSIDCEAQVRTIKEDYSDPFGMFFPRYETRTKKISTSPIKIEVKALPTPPNNFSGAVGTFKVSSSINKHKVKAGDVLSVKLKLKGTGNLKLIDAPSYTFPSSFETYDCKVTDNYEITPAGHSGSKTFEYPVVPREGGTFTIPSMDFSYFDPERHTFMTVKTNPYIVTVVGDKNIGTTPSDIDELNQDIKYIKTGDVSLKSDNVSILFSWKWALAYCLSFTGFILALIFKKRIFRNTPSTPDEKRRHANRLAMKKLENAKSFLNSGKRSAFYEELLNSLYSFTQNKLNIEKEKFNKENVRSLLESHLIESSTIEEYMSIINECEFARFSPAGFTTPMDELYEKAVKIINTIDGALK